MTPREAAKKSLEARSRVLLYLMEGAASFVELQQELQISRRTLYWALDKLLDEGIVRQDGGHYCCEVVLERSARAKTATKPKPLSPTQVLAGEHKHVRNFLLGIGVRLPKVAQPLAAKHPMVLVRAAEAAMVYPRSRQMPMLVVWLPEVDSWVRTWGPETVEQALLESSRKAGEPFPYAKKVLLTKPKLGVALEEERVAI